jgi:hypothetical protein
LLAARGEAVGFQSFRMRVFQIMGNRRLYKIECLHTLGTPESDVLKVTALNLFHPTASPLLQETSLFILRHNLRGEEGSDFPPLQGKGKDGGGAKDMSQKED